MKKLSLNSNILCCIFLYTTFFLLHCYFFYNPNPPNFYYSDIAGYVGNARILLYGYGFPALHCHIYYPGYSFLLMPAIFLAKNDFVTSYKFIEITNSIILSFIPVITYKLIPAFKSDIDNKIRFLIALVIGFYPTYLLYSSLIMSEVLLFPLFLLLVFLVYKLSDESNKLIYWISTSICFGFFLLSTPRAWILLPVIVLTLFLIGFKNKSYKYFLISMICLLSFALLTVFFINKLNFFLAQSYFGKLEIGNTYSLKNLISFFNISEFFSVLCGQLLYLIFSTYGFVLIGLAYSIEKAKLKYYKTDKSYILNLFILLSFFFTLVLSALYFSIYHSTPDHYIYGRYNETTMVPLFIMGIIVILENYLTRRHKIWLIIIALDIYAITLLRFGDALLNIFKLDINILGFYSYKFLFQNLNLIYYGLFVLLVSLFMFIIAGKNKYLSLIILSTVFLSNSIFIGAYPKMSTSKNEKTSSDIIIVNTIDMYSKINPQTIVNFDVEEKNLLYHETPVGVRDKSFLARVGYIKAFEILNIYYRCQLYLPKVKAHRIDSLKSEKPMSDLIVSQRCDLDKIYKGARIIAPKKTKAIVVALNLKLWALPGKNLDYFISKKMVLPKNYCSNLILN